MIFANASVPIAGVVDTAVIGAMGGKEDLGGVALGVTVFNIVAMSFYFLRMGSTGLAAQAMGAEDEARLQRVLVRAVGLAATLGICVVVLRGELSRVAFVALQGGSMVERTGDLYFGVRVLGAPGTFTVYALTGWLIGMGRTGSVLAMHALGSLVNVVLDLWLVMGMGFGVGAVAAAGAVADWSAAAAGGVLVVLLIRARGGIRAGVLELASILDLGAMRRLLALNWDLMVRSWALLLGFAWFINTAARHGAATLAGTHVLMQLVTVWAFVLDAFAFTAEWAVGRAVGRQSVPELRSAIRVTSELAFAVAFVFFLSALVAGPWMLDAWIADPEAGT